MQRRGFLVLLGATAVSAGAAAAALMTEGGTVSTAPPGERALPKLAPNLGDIARFRISRGAMSANFRLDDGHWVVVEKGGYPADETKIHRMLAALADLTLVEPKTDRPELYSRLSLDDPANGKSTEIVIQNKAGDIVGQLIVGRSRPNRLGIGNDGVYVRRIGGDRAWLARGSLDLSGEIADWLDRRIVDEPAGRFRSLVFTSAKGDVLTISRSGMTANFAVENPPEGTKLKDARAVSMPATALEGLDLNDVAPASAMKPPETGVATAEYSTFDGLHFRVTLFPHDRADWVAVEVSGIGDAAVEAKELRNRVARWVYAIPPEKAKLLKTTLGDLTEKAGGS
ncbi:MAG TPA: DUF4340 domain-containing protein [Stellaceae bacterium]|jgi:hypothetical protein